MFPTIRAATEKDRERIHTLSTLSFAQDPPGRYLWPEPEKYHALFPRFAMGLGGRAIPSGTAFLADEGHAAALWLPPGVSSDSEALEAMMAETLDPASPKFPSILGLMEQVEHFHIKEPHWYLAVLMSDPHWIGQGLGSALLKHALALCDRDGLPAYLEASSPRNAALYERHGFQAIGVIQSGDSPRILPMLRAQRR